MEKLYDLSEFEALAMGDEGFIKELLAANIESIEEGIDTYQEKIGRTNKLVFYSQYLDANFIEI